MKAPFVALALIVVLVAAAIILMRAPRQPVTSPSASASAAEAAGRPQTMWPLEPDTKWVYRVAAEGKTVEATVFATEGRQGVRLVEERDGKSVDVDHVEARADGWYWSEHDSTPQPWKLLPGDFPKTKDWEPFENVRARMVRQRTVDVDGKTMDAYEIQYEQADPKRGGAFSKKMLLVFAPGVGIVGKDSMVDGQPGGERWELLRFERGLVPGYQLPIAGRGK